MKDATENPMAQLAVEVRQRALAAVGVLQRDGAVRAAYVFGSQVEGRSDAWSDLDIAAFVDGLESWNLDRRIRAIVLVQKEIGYEIEPHLFDGSHLQQPEAGGFVVEILRRGVRIL